MATPTGADGVALASNDAVLAVDLGLILAVDCSSSVNAATYRLQMNGIAAALRNPSLGQAVASGGRSRIALAMVHWSNSHTQFVAFPWRILASAADLEAAARDIEAAERQWDSGGTGLAAAIDYCSGLFGALPCPADRHVIDVSGDGWDNEGGNAAAARDRAVALGATVNGLPITNGSILLIAYYREQVIGGNGAFLMPADDISAFPDAILRKLLREIGRAVS